MTTSTDSVAVSVSTAPHTRLQRAIERTGLGDGDGNVSFNKGVTAVALAFFGRCIERQYTPHWSVLAFGVVCIGAGFSLKGYLASLALFASRGEAATTPGVP